MNTPKGPPHKSTQKTKRSSVSDSHLGNIHITLVSEKEREIYRIPSYDYILP